jgi:branched-chain amino acid transport system substrate-binding protein
VTLTRRQLLQHATAATGAVALPVLPARAESGRILLGQSAPFSGPAAALGEQFRQGATLAFNHLNARGGIGGRKIELHSLDDGYEPERCAANTRKLIEEGVTALFGYVGTPTSQAAVPLFTEAKVPFIAPFTGAEALRTPFNRHIFHVRASYFDETAEIVQQITSVGGRRVGVFYQNDSYGQTGLAGVNAALKPLGLAPVGLATVERNSVDVRAAVASLLAKSPECIIQVSAYTSCAAFIRAARQAEYTGSFYNVSFVGTQALASELGVYAKGVIVSQVVPYPFGSSKPVAAEYLERIRAAGAGNEPSYGGMEGYIAAKTLIEGLRRAGNNPSSESLITGLESLHDVDLGGFFINFGPQKHAGSKFVEMTMLTEDGRIRH